MSKRNRRTRLPAPVEHVIIESLSHDGRGVVHINGKTVFIDGALPGEDVAFEYLAKRRKFDEGRVTSIHQPSSDRVDPACPHFGLCGGCSLQHMAADAQIHAKQQTLIDNLKHIGDVVPDEILPPLTGSAWGYRTRARLGIKDVIKKGRVLVGFREKRNPYVADLSCCKVLHPSVGEKLDQLAALVERLDARARIPQVEVAVGDDVIALVFRHLDPLGENDLAHLKAFAAEQGFHIYLQSGGPETVKALWPGESGLSYHLPDQDIKINFEPTDFTQVNAGINQQMIARALALLAIEPQHRVLDLFCGLGNFTLPIARQAAEVNGVEGSMDLIERARRNAENNRIGNATFHVVDLTMPPDDAPWLVGDYDRVLLDPPRSGAVEMLDAIAATGARRIVYVSCHPGSLARDAGILVRDKSYRLSATGVMDMFPHTAHMESIALFERA